MEAIVSRVPADGGVTEGRPRDQHLVQCAGNAPPAPGMEGLMTEA